MCEQTFELGHPSREQPHAAAGRQRRKPLGSGASHRWRRSDGWHAHHVLKKEASDEHLDPGAKEGAHVEKGAAP